MNKFLLFLLGVVVGVGACVAYEHNPDYFKKLMSPTTKTSQVANKTPEKPAPSTSFSNDLVTLVGISANQKVTSPLSIKGTAAGKMFFEGQFPIDIVDAKGTVLGKTTAKAQGEWAVPGPVPFTATLTFTGATTSKGMLEFLSDNPSGLIENQLIVQVPVTF